MTAPIDLDAIRGRVDFIRSTYGRVFGSGRLIATLDDAEALIAEVERLRATTDASDLLNGWHNR